MSKDFEKFKRYYNEGYWNEEKLRNITVKGAITWDEYYKIIQNKKSSI